MAKAKAYYGKKTRTGAFPCRFVNIYEKNDKGKFSLELLVPTKEAVALNKELYRDNKLLQDFMKATKKSKLPKPLYSDVYVYDEENKCTLMAEDEETGEEYKVVDKTVKKFTFNTTFSPKVQYKKGLDNSARIGWDSKLSVSTRVYASTFTSDDGTITKYATLNLDAIRVFELVTAEQEADWEDGDDEFEEAKVSVKEESKGEDEDDYTTNTDEADAEEEDWEDAEEEEVKPKKKKTPNKSERNF